MKTRFTACAALLLSLFTSLSAVAEQLDHWEITKDGLTDGEWTFNCSARSTYATGVEDTRELWVLACKVAPSSLATLDFSKPIAEYSGKKYAISSINAYNSGTSWMGDAGRAALQKVVFPKDVNFDVRGSTFANCTNLTEVSPFLPTNCTAWGASVFMGCSKLAMPLVYTGSTQFSEWTIFADSGITSVDLSNSGVTNVSRACFAGCTSLTNVSFPACLSVMGSGMAPFAGCTALKKVIFRSVVDLGIFAAYQGKYSGCTSLSEVHFYDCVPESAPANVFKDTHSGVIMTYLHVSDEQAAAWAPYTQSGVVDNDSTWSKACAGTYYANRPLIKYFEKHVQLAAGVDAVVVKDQKGTFIVSRGDGESAAGDLVVNYTIGGDAVAGADYVALPGSITIPNGSDSATVEVEGIYTGLTSTKSVTLTLAAGDYTIVTEKSTAAIDVKTEYREAGITKIQDAEMATGQVGKFLISRGADDPDDGDFVVYYTIGGTAEAGVAYADDLTGSITIPAGNRSVVLEVVPLNDTTSTGDGTVSVQLVAKGTSIIEGKGSAEINVVHAASFGGWLYQNSTITDGLWTFKATVDSKTMEMAVGKVTVSPGVVSPLNFDKAVVGADGKRYHFLSFECGFVWPGKSQYISYDGFAEFVGSLTLPEGATTIKNYCFGCLTNATGTLKLPSTLTYIGRFAFKDSTYTIQAADFPQKVETLGEGSFKNTQVYGDLYLPLATSVEGSFQNCSELTSVHFGPNLTKITGGNDNGSFSGCTKLTNVVFDANSSVELTPGGSFNGCTALEEIDLTAVTKVHPPNNLNNTNNYSYAPFKDCSSLKKITFGPKLKWLHHMSLYTKYDCLKEVVFLGPPPEFFGVPYGRNPTKYSHGAYIYPEFTTYIENKAVKVKNALGKCWLDYSADGKIARRNTTFAQEFIESDLWSYNPTVDKRPLRLLRPEGLIMLMR